MLNCNQVRMGKMGSELGRHQSQLKMLLSENFEGASHIFKFMRANLSFLGDDW